MQQIMVPLINKAINAEIRLPSSKSLMLRDLWLAGFAEGVSNIKYPARCADADVMATALKEFGVEILDSGDVLRIQGNAGKLAIKERDVYLGGSGISARFLLAASILQQGVTCFDGNESLRARPQGYLLECLEQFAIKLESNSGKLPIRVEVLDRKDPLEISMKGDQSSQFFSALMQIAPLLEHGLKIKVIGDLVSKPYIDLTINEMQKFSVEVLNNNYQEFIIKPSRYQACELEVEGDASAASYFMALACITGGYVKILNLGKSSLQGDLHFYKICETLGAKVVLHESSMEIWGPAGGKLNELKAPVNMEDIPDTAPTLMAIAPLIPGLTRIEGLGTLRLKECDRIAVPARELGKLGVQVREGSDWIEIYERQDLSDLDYANISIDTYDDHRIAMSMALLGTKTGKLKINDPDCVAKTFPDYWKALNHLL